MAVLHNDVNTLTQAQLRGVLNYQVRQDNDSYGRPIYVGYAVPGTLEGNNEWIISKNTYDSNGFLIATNWANNSSDPEFSWTDRALYF